MNSTKAIEKLIQQQAITEQLKKFSSSRAPEFNKWYRDTEVAIKNIFGNKSDHVKEFSAVSYSLSFFTSNTPDSSFHSAYIRGLEQAKTLLESMIDEIKEYGLDTNNSSNTFGLSNKFEPLAIIEPLCHRFHRFARQLQKRYSNRPTITFQDEYDLQDVFHALLRLHFDDVRPEEHTPSYAGAASRMDFLLKQEKIVIELKKTRDNLKAKDVGEQLTIDIARYANHPDCQCLVCFVYDPDGIISNPDGLEKDLERQSSDKLKVRVIIAPKN